MGRIGVIIIDPRGVGVFLFKDGNLMNDFHRAVQETVLVGGCFFGSCFYSFLVSARTHARTSRARGCQPSFSFHERLRSCPLCLACLGSPWSRWRPGRRPFW
eukprot:s182_g17.t1